MEQYYDMVLKSKEGVEFQWTEMEQQRFFPSLQNLAIRHKEDGIRLHLDLPFSSVLLSFLMKNFRGEKVPTDNWLPLENLLLEMESSEDLTLTKIRETLIQHLLTEKNVTNCIGLWRLLHRLRSKHLGEIYQYVMDHLVRAVQNRTIDFQFYRLAMFDVMLLLSSDKLKIQNEVDVFDVMMVWIDACPSQRSSLLPEMIRVVRRAGIPQKVTSLGGVQLNKWKLGDEKARTSGQRMLILGGWEAGPTNHIYILDYVNDVWEKLALQMPYIAAYHGAVWLNSELYIFGGGDNQSTHYSQLFKLNQHLQWEQLASMRERRCYITNSCVELGGHIYVCGGHNGSRALRGRLRTVERYDPAENVWTSITPMRHARSDAAAVSLNGKLFVCGGFNGRDIIASVEYLDPMSDIWTEYRAMPSPRAGLSAVVYDTKIIVLGGFSGAERFASVWQIDITEENFRWTEMPHMLGPRSNFTVCRLGNEIIVAGGYFERTLRTVECFDGLEWRVGPSLPAGRSALRSIALPIDIANSLPIHKSDI